MTRLRNSFVAGLLFVGGPAWAGESLINGQPLQYNYEYHCNGERIVVGHCYDNDDNSYCQDYYPDRPLHNGFMVQPVEKRGDVIAKLNACAVAARAQSEPRETRTVVAAPANAKTGATRRGAAASKAPGLGHATWHMVDSDDDRVTYFTTAAIKRNGKSGKGWFTHVYSKPLDDGSGVFSTFVQALEEGDCTTDSLRLLQVAAYDANQKLVAEGPVPNQRLERVEPDTINAEMLAVLCGRPQHLAERLVGDGKYLWSVTQVMLAIAKKENEKQAR